MDKLSMPKKIYRYAGPGNKPIHDEALPDVEDFVGDELIGEYILNKVQRVKKTTELVDEE